MGSIHCLCIVGWVPIVVIENYSICRCEIDSETAGPSAKQENKYIGPDYRNVQALKVLGMMEP